MNKPELSAQQAVDLARRLWGVTARRVNELPSYDDRNYHLSELEGDTHPDGLLLKVTNTRDSAQPGYLEAQTEVLRRLHARGLPVPEPLAAAAGRHAGAYVVRDPLLAACNGEACALRLLTFLPGTTLLKAQQRDAALYEELGESLAGLSLALAGHDDPALHRDWDWALPCLPATHARIRPTLLEALPRPDVELLDAVAAQFGSQVAVHAGELRHGIIHGDANEQNVLVAPSAPGSAPHWRLAGVIDFGDCSFTWLVSEVAIAMAYISLLHADGSDRGTAAGLAAAGALLRGYERAAPLQAVERRMLRTLCMARLAQSLGMGAYTAALDPGNAEYVLSSQKAGWGMLRALWALSEAEFAQRLGSRLSAAGQRHAVD